MLEGMTRTGQQTDPCHPPAEHCQLLRTTAGVARLEQVLIADCDGQCTKRSTCEVLDEDVLAEGCVAAGRRGQDGADSLFKQAAIRQSTCVAYPSASFPPWFSNCLCTCWMKSSSAW